MPSMRLPPNGLNSPVNNLYVAYEWICVRTQIHSFFNHGNNFDQKTAHFTTAGRAHCLAIARTKLGDHAWRHLMASCFHLYLELFPRTHWHQPGTDICGTHELSRHAQGPTFLG